MSQQINLFNPVFLKQRKIFTALAMAQALGVLVVGIAALAWYSQRSEAELEEQAAQVTRQLEQRQQSLQNASAQLAPRKKSVELEAQIAIMEMQLKALRDVGGVLERGAFGNTHGYAAYFRAFARQDLPGLWLTGVSIDGAGTNIGIEGRAVDAGMVPGYINLLSREPVLKGRTFGSLRITTPQPAEPGAAAAPAQASVPFVEFQLRAEPVRAEG
ncbi:hypothetical protein [Pseudoduganella sp. GCM10020061]|uniref:hypothetical protein n=1 Tax=Pseudoduganella sp. GCM10020061 TaxID=3317345 RepID=UPI003639B517